MISLRALLLTAVRLPRLYSDFRHCSSLYARDVILRSQDARLRLRFGILASFVITPGWIGMEKVESVRLSLERMTSK